MEVNLFLGVLTTERDRDFLVAASLGSRATFKLYPFVYLNMFRLTLAIEAGLLTADLLLELADFADLIGVLERRDFLVLLDLVFLADFLVELLRRFFADDILFLGVYLRELGIVFCTDLTMYSWWRSLC